MALYGPDGFPVSSRLLDAAREDGSRPALISRPQGIRSAINTADWRKVIYVSRYLYHNMGIPHGAINQKADFAVGDSWQPIHVGLDKSPEVKDWVKVTVEWLIGQFYPMCEVRGGAFSFVSALNLDSVAIDVDGGYCVLLTESADGFPQTQRIPVHRMGAPWDSQEKIIDKGEFKGLRLHQGIIYSPAGRPVGARIYEDSVNYASQSDSFEDISERDLIHNYEARAYDQGHGMPAFTPTMNDLRDLKTSKEWEQMTMLMCSQVGLIEENATGGIDTSDPAYRNVQTDPTKPPVNVENFDCGGVNVRYYKANSGQGLKQLVNMKPGEDWERFYDRLVRGALCGINWPASFIWKADGTGVDSREDILQCRAAIAKRQRVLKPVAKRIVGYAVSKAIKNGYIPPYPGSDLGGALRWDFQMPARMTVDDGKEAQQLRENLKMGLTTEDAIASATLGITGDQLREIRVEEIRSNLTAAQQLAGEFGLSMEMMLGLLQQRSPNPITASPAPASTVDTQEGE